MLVVILGRTGRTEFNLPATIAGTVVNIVLNLILIPSHGIVGAGIALVASYLVVLVLMYVLTQRLFPVPYEWGRLALLVGVTAATVAGGELLLPDRRVRRLRAAHPALAGAAGDPARARLPQPRGARRDPGDAEPGGGPGAAAGARRPAAAGNRRGRDGGGSSAEVYEAVRRDEDRL